MTNPPYASWIANANRDPRLDSTNIKVGSLPIPPQLACQPQDIARLSEKDAILTLSSQFQSMTKERLSFIDGAKASHAAHVAKARIFRTF